jgi:parallel beta-helix repeat protein
MILQPGTLLHDRYQIIKQIAQGGMSALYQARDKQDNAVVALKQSLVTDPHLSKAFERESRLLARLRHPTLPEVRDQFSNEAGHLFLVMQFIPGDDLGAMLEREAKKFRTANAILWILRWADELLDALVYLHAQNPPVIHRDIKPQNLKLTSRGEIKLLDFGLAKGSAGDQTRLATVHSVRAYTPQYAPLEQIQGTGTTLQSDLYALAATLYHLMTGKPPPDALTRVATTLSNQPDPLKPAHQANPLVPANISAVLQQAMELNQDERFASATAMRTALRMASQPRKAETSSNNARPAEEPASTGQTTIHAPTTGGEQTIMEAAPDATAQPDLFHLYPTVIVSQQGEGHHTTLHDAVANARPGTRIFVRPGRYREGVVLDKRLEILGDGPPEEIILESTGCPCIQMQTDEATLRGLTLRTLAEKNDALPVAGVDICQGRLIIEGCDISAEAQTCVAIHGEHANPFIWNCKIHDGTGNGLSFYDQGQGIIEECEVVGNGRAGVKIFKKGSPLLRRCTIHHGKQAGVYVRDNGAGMLESCDIHHNERAGVEIKKESHPFLRWCTIHNQASGYGIYVTEKGEGIIEECDISSNAEAGVGITLGGNPLFQRCTVHHEKQRGLVVFESGLGLIDGCEIFENTKMGICITQEGNPIIRGCTIRDSEQIGIGILNNGSGLIEQCTISGNMTGIEIKEHSNPVIRSSTIRQNGTVAIMVHKNGAGVVEENDLTGNKRGAWYVEDGCLVLGSGNRE